MTQPISSSKFVERSRLDDRLMHLRIVLDIARSEGPDQLASPMLVFTAATLLRDIYRLVSREPGARTLPRPSIQHPPSLRALGAMLRDGGLALDAFAHNHRRL